MLIACRVEGNLQRAIAHIGPSAYRSSPEPMRTATPGPRAASRAGALLTFALSAVLGIAVAGGGGAAGLTLWWTRQSTADGNPRAVRWALGNGALLAIAGAAIGLVTALVASVMTRQGHARWRVATMGLVAGGAVGGLLGWSLGEEAGGVPVAVACVIAEPLVGLLAALWAAWRAA